MRETGFSSKIPASTPKGVKAAVLASADSIVTITDTDIIRQSNTDMSRWAVAAMARDDTKQ